MQQAGAKLLKHYRETAFMGAWEVLLNIRTVLSNFRTCRNQIAEFRPDVVILIDYPGFNLRIARYARQLKLKVYYYISPKFWAWREGRIKQVRRYVDRMFIIFPFETEFYKKHGYNATYIGNPLVDHVESVRRELPDRDSLLRSLGLDNRPVIALLAGSRYQEVRYVLPEMVKIAGGYPDYQFVVAAVAHIPAELYATLTASMPVRVITGKTYELLSVAEAALVTSGTATLETALFDVPQVVCYKTSAMTYRLAMLFLRARFISLVNLIMDREIVTELVQNKLNEGTLNRELAHILRSGLRHKMMKSEYTSLRQMLGREGASERIAREIFTSLKPAPPES